MPHFPTVQRVIFLCSSFDCLAPSFAPPCDTSYSVQRAGHEQVELTFVTRATVSQIFRANKPSFRFRCRRFLRLAPREHRELVFARGGVCRTSLLVHRVIFLCSLFARPAPACNTSYSVERGQGMSMSSWRLWQELRYPKSFMCVNRPSLSGSSALPRRRFLRLVLTVSSIGEGRHEHCELVFARYATLLQCSPGFIRVKV